MTTAALPVAVLASAPPPASAPAGAGDAAPDPTALMTRVATGDREAFVALYEAMAPRVLGLAHRILMNRALAEETMQEVFLEVWSKAASFDRSRGTAAGWVLTIAHHRSVDRVRSCRNAADRDFEVGVRAVEVDRDIVSDGFDDRARAIEVREALARLTARQRQVLTLAYYGGCTQSEIAAILGAPLGTVKSATRAALRRLRGMLPSTE